MHDTIADSVLPKTCPACGAEWNDYGPADGDEFEGAIYGCELALYVEDGVIYLDSHCEEAITPWLKSRNIELQQSMER